MSKKKDVIFTSPRGGKYEGEHKDGKRHGQGKLTYPDGRKFVGEWKDGEPIVIEPHLFSVSLFNSMLKSTIPLKTSLNTFSILSSTYQYSLVNVNNS